MSVGKLRFVIFVWFLFTYESCLCRYVAQNNCLKVSSPKHLKGSYGCAFSDFGVPQHGGTLTGIVVYPKANQKACKAFTHELTLKTRTPGSLPVFLLVDRGDCYTMFKAWNAQNAGAAAILVVNDLYGPLTKMDLPEEEGVDDYYMQNITIPLVLISLSHGTSIKKALNNNDLVRVNFEWAEADPHPNERVDYEFEETIDDECGSWCDGQIQKQAQWEVHLNTERSSVIEPMWVALIMHKIQKWSIFLCKNLMLEI